MVQIVSQRSSARLAFCDRSALPGAVDGAWWPNTRDLREELPDLVAVVSLLIGPVHRVVYDPSMWPEAPSRIIRGTAVISVDPYAMVARDTIYLVGTHARTGDVVHRVLRAVADAIHPMSAPVLRHLVEHFTKAPERSAP